tara:strand:+ start:2082 stop:2822 length:741 start_codon:yes stop_codon:yes gene_type:complete
MISSDAPPFVVECAGPSGCGKSTFLKRLMEEIGEPFVAVHTGLDFQSPLLPAHLADLTKQNIKTDIHMLPWFILFSFKHISFTIFSLKRIIAAPASWRHKIAIFRSFIRKTGLSVFLKTTGFNGHFVLVDEGLIQSLHNFLVFPNGKVDDKYAEKFSELVPLPDKIVYFNQSADSISNQLLERGVFSPRLKGSDEVKAFVQNAHNAFSVFSKNPRLNDCLVPVPDSSMESAENFASRLGYGRQGSV